jgi:uncharacterized protein YecE (DUF72 family)
MSGANLPCVLRATAPFVYVRLHGPDHHHLYTGSYSDDELRWWSRRIAKAMNRDVFVYFNNDGGGHEVRNARRLTELTLM